MPPKVKRGLNVGLTVAFIAALVIFMITFSIGIPIYCRFLYYIQINTLGLPEKTGWSYEVIKEAYDDILNFCTMPGYPCQTGQLKLSSDGAAHFADCKGLFSLNFWALIVSGVITLTLTLLNRFKVITLSRPFGHGAQLLAAVIAVALPIVIILLVLIVGFDAAFEAFHTIFFPGKTNWIFDAREDQIINVMPQEFFLNCAIIIAVALVTFSAVLIITEVVIGRRRKKQSDKNGSEPVI
ncbi:MAG: TIGR01906 family membrane protein [Candidatus Coproplasma sp.]